MRINCLYTKLLLGFFATLGMVALCLALLFSYFVGARLQEDGDNELQAAFRLSSTGLSLLAPPDRRASDAARRELQVFVDDLEVVYEGPVWLRHANGTVFMASNGQPVPAFTESDRYTRDQLVYGTVHQAPYTYHLSYPVSFFGYDGTLEVLGCEDIHNRHVVMTLLWVMVVVVGGISLLAFPFVRRITGPLRRLEEGALQCAAGNLDFRVEIPQRDELGRVAKAFNAMADSVQDMLRLKQELMANVSHEMRSPLARMRVALELAQQDTAGHQCTNAARHLAIVEEEVEAMDAVIGEVLAISRYGIEERVRRRGACDMAEMVRAVLDKYALLMSSRRIRLEAMLPASLTVHCQYEALPTAIRNMVENAVKFTPEGGMIRVELDQLPGATRLRMTNSYAPLSECQLKGIFQPFARIEGESVPGTGLGLALTDRIIVGHGGTIVAENVPDGIMFTVLLPVQEPMEEMP